jgi:hypothetical protein
VFKGLRHIVKTDNQWRMRLHDLPPWPVAYQQMRRRMPLWIKATRGESAALAAEQHGEQLEVVKHTGPNVGSRSCTVVR